MILSFSLTTELLDPEPELSIDPDSERLSQALLEWEGR